ncbi:hypothetical protein DOY81_005348 [Sarcophaga bullata]|nr:hypothetical protein DOY81_005348 [Sarcophaga bullata]
MSLSNYTNIKKDLPKFAAIEYGAFKMVVDDNGKICALCINGSKKTSGVMVVGYQLLLKRNDKIGIKKHIVGVAIAIAIAIARCHCINLIN